MIVQESEIPELHCPDAREGGRLAFQCPRLYLANFFLWNSSQECKELHVFPPGQQLRDGIKLWAVTHVLMYFMDV